ncbi:uncharacterized protein RAG0_15429 [Rhynchosporium agropyri]|uniref:Uncharacterized protein n=1 Tax=Rhynchosporium agropyri TaxID=914238 RepID=A0A1E1LL67_9HELO|nr:uncharacterized protein RAG0_15429 [Rhynchosporium agropyri]
MQLHAILLLLVTGLLDAAPVAQAYPPPSLSLSAVVPKPTNTVKLEPSLSRSTIVLPSAPANWTLPPKPTWTDSVKPTGPTYTLPPKPTGTNIPTKPTSTFPPKPTVTVIPTKPAYTLPPKPTVTVTPPKPASTTAPPQPTRVTSKKPVPTYTHEEDEYKDDE